MGVQVICFRFSRPPIGPLEVCMRHAPRGGSRRLRRSRYRQNLRECDRSAQDLPIRPHWPSLHDWSRSIVIPSRIESIYIDWRAVSSKRIFPKSREANSSHGPLFFLSRDFGKISLLYRKQGTLSGFAVRGDCARGRTLSKPGSIPSFSRYDVNDEKLL